jgi:ribonuclease Z
MSLATGFTWTHKNLRLVGYSVAGISTSIVFPDAHACFDVAQGLPYQIGVPHLLISHGHMDHASGLPYLISQKAMTGQAPPNVWMPEALVNPMREIMRIWERIDGHTYQYQFRAAKVGEEIPLGAPYFARAVPSFHRVPSVGYVIYERKKRLKIEFANLEPSELGRLRREGLILDEPLEEPVIAFSGDTTIEFLDSPDVQRARLLILEVTYWDKKKTVENARTWGHIHLDEVLPRLESLKNEKILFIHASARYSTKDLRAIIDDRVPEQFKTRVDIFPRPI